MAGGAFAVPVATDVLEGAAEGAAGGEAEAEGAASSSAGGAAESEGASAVNGLGLMCADVLGREERLGIADWVQGRVVLSPGTTPFPGPIDLSVTPYLRGALNAFAVPRWQDFWLVWGAQLGKTTLEKCVWAYLVRNDPDAAMIVYPSQADARRKSRNHYQRLIRDTPELSALMTDRKDDLSNFEMTLAVMTTLFGWAGSPTVLSGEPIRYLIADEAAKWSWTDKDEAHPIDLAFRRTTFYAELAKRIAVTTPNREDNYGWRDLERSTWHEFWVPCPLCGDVEAVADVPELVSDPDVDIRALRRRMQQAGWQVLEWEVLRDGERFGITGWGDSRDPDEVERLARYRCEHCGEAFDDRAKDEGAVPFGKWVPRHPERSVCGMHLASWYSPRVRFGEVARRFYAALGIPEKMMDWVNSDRAHPTREEAIKPTEEEIREHQGPYSMGTIPFAPVAVTATVDVQEHEFWVRVAAWTATEGVALVEVMRLDRWGSDDPKAKDYAWQVLEDRVRRGMWEGPDGKLYGVDLMGVDSGAFTDAAYDFCRGRPRVLPMKGADNQVAPIQYSEPELVLNRAGKKVARKGGVRLITWATKYWRDSLAGRMKTALDSPAAWMVPQDAPDVFYQHMTGEEKRVVRNKYGRVEYVWVTTHANHLRDCSVMELVLAQMLEVGRRGGRRAHAVPKKGHRPAAAEDVATVQEEVKRRRGTAKRNWVTMGR